MQNASSRLGVSGDPALPDSVRLSFPSALKLNAWAIIAVAAAVASRIWLREQPQLGPWGRGLVGLMPLVPVVLHARVVGRWLRSLDEMQRLLQTEVLVGALAAVLGVYLSMDLLRGAGAIRTLALGWEGCFVLAFGFWSVGVLVANRRYR